MAQETTLPPQHQERQPGIESEMRPRPQIDDPEYRGSEKLLDRVALITGGDSGIGSAVINTTSVTAYRGSSSLLDYSATKGAIVALTRSLSSKLAEKGIRVNGVAPGPVWTPLIPASFSAEKVSKFGAKEPLGRPAQPCEIAPSYVFLAARDPSYMTGQVLHPNGGELIGG